MYKNDKNSKHFFNLHGKKYTREEKVRKIPILVEKICLKNYLMNVYTNAHKQSDSLRTQKSEHT